MGAGEMPLDARALVGAGPDTALVASCRSGDAVCPWHGLAARAISSANGAMAIVVGIRWTGKWPIRAILPGARRRPR